MSSSTTSFSTPASVEVIFDANKGRCLRAKRRFSPGDVIFTEEALVFSSDSDYRRVLKNPIVRKAMHKSFFSNFDDIMEQLEDLSKVQAADTAQNLIQLVALYAAGDANDFDPVKRRLLEELTAANLDECVDCIKLFRKANGKVIPKSLPNELVGKLLGVLNTNQHELEDFGGSGLFVFAAIMEHDCWPNCSFSTTGTTLRVTAVQPIEAGQALSIDYSNMYYSPTSERIDYLKKVYNFACSCALCSGPDRKRAFSCPNCFTYEAFSAYSSGPARFKDSKLVRDNRSYFLPKSAGCKEGEFTACFLCGKLPSVEYAAKCFEAESNMAGPSMPKISSLERLKDFQKTFPYLHPTHHLYFLLLDGLTISLTDDATQTKPIGKPLKTSSSSSSASSGGGGSGSNKEGPYDRALAVMIHQEELMESDVVPPNHHEKIIFFDKIAQLAIAAGKLDVAKSYYTKALSMAAKVVSSSSTDWASIQLITDLKYLSENTPASAQELANYYSKGNGGGDGDDDDWEDVDE